MKIATAKLTGISTLSFGRYHNIPKLKKEMPADYEARTWLEKIHYDPETFEAYIPPFALKNTIANSASFLSIKIPGQASTKYTKYFLSGVMVYEPAYIGHKINDAIQFALMVPSNGIRGGTTRVLKYFPTFPEWSCRPRFFILNDIITQDIFLQCLEEGGNFIGLMQGNPLHGGIFGRYSVSEFKWEEHNE